MRPTSRRGSSGRHHALKRWLIASAKLARAVTRFAVSGTTSEEARMVDPTEVLAEALGNRLAENYRRAFSGREPRYTEPIAEAARLALERIGSSDALYHSAEHTALVTLVGQ